MSPTALLILFLSIAILGALWEKLFLHLYRTFTKKHLRKNHFTFSHYIYLLLMPLVALFVLVFFKGISILEVFLLFAFCGPILEWLIGYAYHAFIGQNLWTYHRYAITGYTSFLTLPFWGIGGVLFYMLAQVIH